MNQELLKQARDTINKIINENSSVFIVFYQPKKGNSEGQEVDDLFAAPLSMTMRGRLFLSSDNLGAYMPAIPGLTAAEVPFLLVNFMSGSIKENGVYEINGNRYTIKKVNPIRRFNGIIGYVCPLKEAVEIARDT